MPLLQEINIENIAHGLIWEITESETFFAEKLPTPLKEDMAFKEAIARRRIEILAGKFLIFELTQRLFFKDKNNKPFLENSLDSISLSHSKNLIFALFSPRLCGIDIQYVTPRIDRIAWRVMNVEKIALIDSVQTTLHWHIYWCSKEALYKAYGKRGLHFKNEIKIIPFAHVPEINLQPFLISEGTVETENFKKDFLIYFNTLVNKNEKFVWVIVLEKEK